MNENLGNALVVLLVIVLVLVVAVLVSVFVLHKKIPFLPHATGHKDSRNDNNKDKGSGDHSEGFCM